ncbi:reverse transcriptase [Tanacetum coccineum]|uniref:Reverse transcriptase n=1 Tax=Tanacetum coccineum TaxID=301880 RepID=A0ABQ5FVK9_9ASTR
MLTPLVTNTISMQLEAPLLQVEIDKAVKNLGPHKAPGEDGFPGLFFQKYWHIVGDAVSKAIKRFFDNGIIPRTLNKTLVVLLPKVPFPETIGQFRPISLCNFVYRVISKVMANRLKPFMHRIISPQQSAFIPGRLIQDCIVVANEAFHYIRNKKKRDQRVMALKLDLTKTFDKPGQCINFAKPELMFSPNTSYDVQKEFCDRLGVKVMGRHSRYLGLPSIHGRNKGELFSFILEKVLHKLQEWKHKFLSQAGREVLIKAVIQAIPSYVMHCYMLPKGVAALYKPMFFLGSCFKRNLFPRSNFLNATKGSHPSWLWQSLLQGRDLLLRGIRWQVGNGSNIQFWTQNWVPYQDDFYIRKPRGPFASNALVSDFITNCEWDLSKLQFCVHLEEVKFISQIPISSTSLDKIVWHYEPNGNYTIKSGYYQAILQREVNSKPEASLSSTPNKSLWKQVWNLKTLPKIRMFWWKACSNALATYENLSRRGCYCLPICPICYTKIETVEHVLFECSWTKVVWFGSSLGLRLDNISGPIVSRVQQLLDMVPSNSERIKFHRSLANIAWQIWKSRNAYVFTDVRTCPSSTISRLNCISRDFNSVFPSSLPISYRASSGIIVRDSTGSIILCYGEIICTYNPLTAELFAIQSACRLALTYGWQNVIVESDCKAAISLASSDIDPPWSLYAIVADIRIWASQLALSFLWVKRECNLASHLVAKIACISHENFLWDDSFPDVITSVARSDII